MEIGVPVQGFMPTAPSFEEAFDLEAEEPGSPIPDPATATGPKKMLTIVDESGEVLSGLVSNSVHRALMRNIVRQKRDFSKKREEWIKRVIKANLVIAILASLLLPVYSHNDDFSNQPNTDWNKVFDEKINSFNAWASNMKRDIAIEIFKTVWRTMFNALIAAPGFVYHGTKFITIDIPIRVYQEGNVVLAVFNLTLIAIFTILIYAAMCFTYVQLNQWWKKYSLVIRNTNNLMRELPWILRNAIFFWKKPILVLGNEEIVTAKKNAQGNYDLYINGKVIETVQAPKPIVKEMAFSGSRRKDVAKVEHLDDRILRTQVAFYYHKDDTNEYSFVGQGTLVKVVRTNSIVENYVVTAAHVADASTHFSALNAHGSAGQRFVSIPKYAIKTSYQRVGDLDFAAFEVSQSQISKACVPMYPSLTPAVADAYILENSIGECVGLGDPFTDCGKGFFHSHGPYVDSPVPPDDGTHYIGGHQISTKKGWSGCGIFLRKGSVLHLTGVHIGQVGEVNSFVVYEHAGEWLSNYDKSEKEAAEGSGQRKNRKYGAGDGRKGFDAKMRRSDKNDYSNAGGDYAGYASKDKRESVKPTTEEQSDYESFPSSDDEIQPVREKKSKAKSQQSKLNEQARAQKALEMVMQKLQAKNPAFQPPVQKPLTGGTAVTSTENQARVSFGPEQTTNSTPQLPTTDISSSETARGRSRERSVRKEMNTSEHCSRNGSPVSRKNSDTQNTPKRQYCSLSPSTTQRNTQESSFEEVIGKSRKKALQKATNSMALNGLSQSAIDLMKSLSKNDLTILSNKLSATSTPNPPQGTPTALSTTQTAECSKRQEITSEAKFGSALRKSTSTKENSAHTKPAAPSGSRRA